MGKRIVALLVRAGYHVRVLSSRKSDNVAGQVHFIHGSITCFEKVADAVRGCSAVIHCAGEKHNSQLMRDVNINGTRNVHNAVSRCNVNFYCYISSVGVIGTTHLKIVDEFTPCRPMNLYEQTKFEAEKIVTQGIDSGSTVILRPTNIFGAESLDSIISTTLPARFKRWVRGRENAHLVYVEDVAVAVVHFLQNQPKGRCETFIISCDDTPGNTVAEIYSRLTNLIGNPKHVTLKGAPLFVPWILRKVRHGVSNWGDIRYSSKYLFDTGFKMPFGLNKGLNEIIKARKHK